MSKLLGLLIVGLTLASCTGNIPKPDAPKHQPEPNSLHKTLSEFFKPHD